MDSWKQASFFGPPRSYSNGQWYVKEDSDVLVSSIDWRTENFVNSNSSLNGREMCNKMQLPVAI